MNKEYLRWFIEKAVAEDIGDGDHTSLSCIPETEKGKAKLLVKQDGILAGIEVAKEVFTYFDSSIEFEQVLHDGARVKYGDIAFYVTGKSQILTQAERLTLNIMQRMSGIATETDRYVQLLEGLHTKILDTRKTTPLNRFLEKEAVRIGGGVNHRNGLYDMIMIKDNHIDFAGGIKQAITNVVNYLAENNKQLKIEIEARSIADIEEIMRIGKVDRIMLDNFTVEQTKQAVELINGQYETESSGGINYQTIRAYAECGVDYVSIGALTHQIKSLDLSLKAM